MRPMAAATRLSCGIPRSPSAARIEKGLSSPKALTSACTKSGRLVPRADQSRPSSLRRSTLRSVTKTSALARICSRIASTSTCAASLVALRFTGIRLLPRCQTRYPSPNASALGMMRFCLPYSNQITSAPKSAMTIVARPAAGLWLTSTTVRPAKTDSTSASPHLFAIKIYQSLRLGNPSASGQANHQQRCHHPAAILHL